MLGYDAARLWLITFVIGAVLAGISGVLYTAWERHERRPEHGHNGTGAADWVAVGGSSDLTSTVVGTLVVLAASRRSRSTAARWPLVFMGVLLVLTVLIAPNSLVLGAMNWLGRLAASFAQRAG